MKPPGFHDEGEGEIDEPQPHRLHARHFRDEPTDLYGWRGTCVHASNLLSRSKQRDWHL